MVTRFYFPVSTAAPISPAFAAGWDYVTEALRRKLVKTKGTSAITIGSRIGPWTAGQDALDRQYVSDAMPAGIDFTGCTVKMQLMTREYATTDNVKARIVLKIVNGAGIVQQTLLALADYGNNTEFRNLTAHENRTFANGDIVAGTYVTSAGDRLVLEIGYTDVPTGTTPEASAKWGENATDLPENETQTTNGAGWLELSINVFQKSKTFTVDAEIKKVGTKTWTVDGIKKKAATKTFAADAALKKATTSDFAADAVLIPGSTPQKEFTLDAILKKALTAALATDAVLEAALIKTFSADAALKKALTKTFTTNKTIDYGSDGNYLGGDGNYIIGDGNYIGQDFSDKRKDFAADAVLKKATAKTFTVDAFIFNPPSTFFLADAVLLAKQRDLTKTFTADAELKALTNSLTLTIDARLVSAITGVTFKADAMLKKAGSKTFTADAIVTISGTLAAPHNEDAISMTGAPSSAKLGTETQEQVQIQ